LGGKIIVAHRIAAQQILETKIWHSAFYFILFITGENSPKREIKNLNFKK